MFATWKYTLRRLLVPTLCWGLLMFGVGFLIVFSFDYMIQKNEQLLIDLVANMPAPLRALVGDPAQFATPKGFLDAKFFLQGGLLLGICAVLTGSGLLATDEEKGRLDLLASYPVSRRGLFWGRTLALAASITTVVLLAWMGLVAALPLTELDVAPLALGLGCLTLLALAMVYAGMALLFSLLLPSRRVAAGIAGAALFVSFLLAMLAPGIDFLRPAHGVLPFRYYQGGQAMGHLDVGSLLVLVGLTAVELLAAWWRFERRDIRVIGEGVFKPGKAAVGLAACMVVYAAVVGPAVAWKGWAPPQKGSPADLMNVEAPTSDGLDGFLPGK